MKRLITGLGLSAMAAVLIGACAAAAATPVPPPDPTPVPTPIATPEWTPLVVTPMPVVTPPTPSDPKAPAYVTMYGRVWLAKDVTRVQDGDCEHVSGGIVEGNGTASDARLSGASRFEVNGDGCGGVGFEYGKMRIENPAGAWEGFCSGGIWNAENASNLACWLTGSGAYDGLSAYTSGTSAGSGTESIGVILPRPAPKQP